jgi:curved DNA-binding protein
VDLFTAILGGSTIVSTLAGNVTLTIPAGTQPGQTFRLKDRGLPELRQPNKFGNLFVKVKVELPRNLTKEQRELFEKLRSS